MNFSKKLIPGISFCLVLLLSSCIFQRDFGYAHKVYFDCNGGETMLIGKRNFDYMVIYDGPNQEGSFDRNDTIMVSYDWLTARCREHGDTIILSVDSLFDKKKRRLTLSVYSRNEYDDIDIIQTGR